MFTELHHNIITNDVTDGVTNGVTVSVCVHSKIRYYLYTMHSTLNFNMIVHLHVDDVISLGMNEMAQKK